MRYLFVLIGVLLLSSFAYAEMHVSVNFNVERQPIWGPTGYDHVEYYYLPDIGVYYNIPQQKFFYSDRGRWRSSSYLPSRYRGYDFYNSYKVVVNDPKPYLNDAKYKEQYASFKDHHDQQSIRDSQDSKYFVNPKHPQHNNWVKQQRHGRGYSSSQNRGNTHSGR